MPPYGILREGRVALTLIVSGRELLCKLKTDEELEFI